MKLKICGVTGQRDLDLAQELGFDFCGFIFHPQSPRKVTPEHVASLKSGRLLRVGVFVDQDVAEIAHIMRLAKLDYAQLHGSQTPEDSCCLGTERVIRVLWPQKYASLEELEQDASAHKCAFFLLDAGISGGGSRCALDWGGLARLRLSAPWFLAGGLGPANVAEAIRVCRPWALDFNSGLEDSPGCKNHEKMRAAVLAARHEAQE